MSKRKSKQACGLCGKDPAAGYAGIDGIRYCHGDDEPGTCYARAKSAYMQGLRDKNWEDVGTYVLKVRRDR